MTKLSSTDKLVYGLLYTLGSKSDLIYPKNDFIAHTLGLTLYQVKKSLNTLKNEELIEIINPNRYRQIKIMPLVPVSKTNSKQLDPNLNDLLEQIYDKL